MKRADWETFMLAALGEAELSLREGNCGFGAVIVKDGEIVAQSHDTEKTDRDPTAHAELTAIRKASAILGRRLDGCQLASTHEPCPMCATAILWAGIESVAYGYSIEEALREGRNRIDLPCKEIFARANKRVDVCEGVLHDRCAVLYNREIRTQIEMLRGASEDDMRRMADEILVKRLAWLEANSVPTCSEEDDPVGRAYEVLLRKLDVSPEQAPILDRGPRHIRFASRNFCPTLEACRILALDTRVVCRHLTEKATDGMLRRLDPRLRFGRNYDRLRPHGEYCEEFILLEE